MTTTTIAIPSTRYIVQTSAARMPTSCWGRYRNVAVLEVDADRDSVAMISTRARGCRRIVSYRGKLNVGSSGRDAYSVALREAYGLAARLNAA